MRESCRGRLGCGATQSLPLHLDDKVHVDGDRLLIERRGAEAEVADRREYRRVQLGIEGFYNLSFLNSACRVDLQLQDDFRTGRAPCVECGAGEVDVGGRNELRISHSGANWPEMG